MKIYPFLFLILFSLTVYAQEQTAPKPQQPKTKEPAGMNAPQKHQVLEALAGEWTASTKFASSAAQAESGSAEAKLILGERFLWTEATGTTAAKAYTKVKILGYDDIEKKYQTVWIDDDHNDMLLMKGVSDDGKKFTFLGSSHDSQNKPVIMKAILTITDKDHYGWQLYRLEQDGKGTEIMEVVYTRK